MKNGSESDGWTNNCHSKTGVDIMLGAYHTHTALKLTGSDFKACDIEHEINQ